MERRLGTARGRISRCQEIAVGRVIGHCGQVALVHGGAVGLACGQVFDATMQIVWTDTAQDPLGHWTESDVVPWASRVA